MNKLERTQITERKFKKRLNSMGVPHIEYAFKHQGRPCSCYACKKPRYKRTTNIYDETMQIIERTNIAMGKKKASKPKVKSSLTTKLSYSEIPNK